MVQARRQRPGHCLHLRPRQTRDDRAEVSYGTDNMGRHNSLSQAWSNPCEAGTSMLAQNVQFDLAGRMTSMQYRVAQPTGSVYDYVDNCGGWGYYTTYSDISQTETRAYNDN